MKTLSQNLFLQATLAAVLVSLLAGHVKAQTFTTLHSFSASAPDRDLPILASTNSDGESVYAGLVLSGNTLYGTACNGGTNGTGTIFAVNTDGTGFRLVHTFSQNYGTNTDGVNPSGGLILSGNTLYGTAGDGGFNGVGTVFAVNTNGTGFTVLHHFGITNTDGLTPSGSLILSGNTLFGTTQYATNNGSGTVFAVNTDGNGFSIVHRFSNLFAETNSEGSRPWAELTLSSNILYGTTEEGGTNGFGSVFAVKTDGTGFKVLHMFNGTDGANSESGLTLSGNTLYGTTPGTVFAVNTDGTGFTNLYNIGSSAGLILSGKTLYGTSGTSYGPGQQGYGSVFAFNTNGTGFTTLYNFYGNPNMYSPYAGLILSGSTLYGTTLAGGTNGNGGVFSLSFPSPQLSINRFGTNVDLTWSSLVDAFNGGLSLQSTTNLIPPFVWTAASPAPVIINGQYVVTNAITGPQRFYRLSQ
jgi:uncharacterized repeat protein (TIGR03803 family)